MEEALAYFHELRTVFIDTGVHPEGVGLPRQHSLLHYPHAIRLFGSPNGLSSCIMESKHIHAVKRVWRRSNRNDLIEQMCRTLTHKNKLAAACIEYGRHGMLQNDILTAARLDVGDVEAEDLQAAQDLVRIEERDAQADDGPQSDGYISLGERYRAYLSVCFCKW